jgi:hypothetical protein
LLVTRGDDAGEGSSWLHPCLRPPSGAPPHELRWSVIGERDGFAAKLPREEGREGVGGSDEEEGKGPTVAQERERERNQMSPVGGVGGRREEETDAWGP